MRNYCDAKSLKQIAVYLRHKIRSTENLNVPVAPAKDLKPVEPKVDPIYEAFLSRNPHISR